MSENAVNGAAAVAPSQEAPVRNKYANPKKKRKMPKWLKLVIWIVILAAFAVGAYMLINKLSKKAEPTLQTGIVSRGTLMSQVTGWGSIVPQEKKEYGAKVRGTVTEILVKSGDLVKAGDLLFVVDPTDLRTELTAAEDALRAAQLRVDEANKALSKTTLSAPFSGKLIVASALKQGQEITAGAPVGTLADDSVMRLSLYFSYAYEASVKAGMTINVSVPDSMALVKGTIESVDKVEKPIDGAICFRANITIQNPGTLADGQLASGYISGSSGDIMPADTGKLSYNDKIELTMPVGGKLTVADVMEYKFYKKGATLCSVDNASLLPTLNDAVKARDEAQKKVTEIQDSITNTEIRSEIDGMVSAMILNVGDKLTASGTSVITISNTDALRVDIQIDEMDVSKVQLGMPVQITYNDNAEMAEGTLTYLSFEAKTEQGGGWNSGAVAYFPAQISIENSGKLLPGMGVNYTITSTVKEDCLMVPSPAVVFSETGTVVYVSKNHASEYTAATLPEGTVIPEGYFPVAVEIGLSDDSNTEIVSGINEGTEVYVTTNSNDFGGGMMVG